MLGGYESYARASGRGHRYGVVSAPAGMAVLAPMRGGFKSNDHLVEALGCQAHGVNGPITMR